VHGQAICPVHSPVHGDQLHADDRLLLLHVRRSTAMLSLPPGLVSLPVHGDGRRTGNHVGRATDSWMDGWMDGWMDASMH